MNRNWNKLFVITSIILSVCFWMGFIWIRFQIIDMQNNLKAYHYIQDELNETINLLSDEIKTLKKEELIITPNSIDTTQRPTPDISIQPSKKITQYKKIDIIANPDKKDVTDTRAQALYSTFITKEHYYGKETCITNVKIELDVLSIDNNPANVIETGSSLAFSIKNKSKNRKSLSEVRLQADQFKISRNSIRGSFKEINSKNVDPSDLSPLNNYYERIVRLTGNIVENRIEGKLYWTEIGEDNFTSCKIEVPFSLLIK